ncbi:MAG: c-type cytochrome biogenesis protein CcmI, partial [Gammaproteobacteria bacterium]|nr:c-type cytochrome biogenesis protein CcmI [Gammaproteobacteria bacterium]
MLSFFLITGLLVLLALAFVVPVLLKNNQLEAEHFDEQNIQIARDRLEELRQDLENGRIGQQEFDQVKQELEDNLALDLSVSQTDSVSVVTGSSKGLAYTLLVAVPVVAAAIYSQVGEFGAITGEVVKVDNHMNQPPNMSMEEAVAGLKARLEMEPDNAEGWFMLARTYAVTEQYKEAAQAYEKTLELVGDNANLLLRYADMIIMSQGGQMSNQARDIILKAVELEPDNLQGLWMAGMVASTQGDYNKALSFWYRLEPMLKNDIDSLTQLREQISQVEKNLGSDAVAELKSAIVGSEPVTTAKAEITVSVSLDQALRDKIAATDTLFV